jgi:DNA-binding MarR family transcriptional regulator
MQSLLQHELRQTRPFTSLEQEAWLSVERTAAVLRHGLTEALRTFGVTPAQYNVLRILRGAGARGLCRHEIGDRLVAQVPDVTRLLDRMEEAALVTRERSSEDRRMVTTRITAEGLALLERIDEPLASLHERRLAHLTQHQLRMLIDLLALARRGG